MFQKPLMTIKFVIPLHYHVHTSSKAILGLLHFDIEQFSQPSKTIYWDTYTIDETFIFFLSCVECLVQNCFSNN